MNEADKYKAMFSQVRTDLQIDMEGLKMKRQHTAKKRIIVTFATICVMAAFSLTAFAANLFGLQDLVLNRKEPAAPAQSADGGVNNADVNESAGIEQPSPRGLDAMQLISLQGYAESNEFKAAAEWLAFTNSYDTDGAILSAVGNGPTGLDAKYDLYLVYSQEMADILEEILTRYGLKLHSELTFLPSDDELAAAVADGNFLGENANVSGYMYEDGTFQFDGQTDSGILYQFMAYKKGSFTEAMLNIGDVADYTEWQYQTVCGLTASLSFSPYKSLIMIGTDTALITVNVLAGSDDGFTKTDLEALADSFDYSLLK